MLKKQSEFIELYIKRYLYDGREEKRRETMATEKGESSSYVKPRTLKEAIILVLQEAGPGGLTVKEIVQRIKKKKWWDWKNDKQGSSSVSDACRVPSNGDIFVRVAPGTYALWALQDDDFDPNEKPMSLKEAIILVLQEAGPEGLTVREIVERIKEDELWDWENEQSGPGSVSDACCEPSNGDIFVRVAPGTYALWALQDDDFTPYVKPMELKEAIILVLQEAGPGGLTVREIVERIKEDELWDWENEQSGPRSVSATCCNNPDVFVKHSFGVYALRSLQGGEGEGSSQRCNSCEETDNGSGSSSIICEETCVSSQQDHEEEEQTVDEVDVNATTVTASGRVSKVPPRLSSLEEWKRVMECPQQGSSPSKEQSNRSPRGTKRAGEAAIHRPHQKPGRPRKMKKVEKCIIKPYVYTNVRVHKDGRLFLF